MKKADTILIAIICLTMVFGYFYVINSQPKIDANSDVYVEISSDGVLIDRIKLDENTDYHKVITNGNLHQEVVINSEGARVVKSDCPDQICVKTGLINASTINKSIVCAPAKLVITVVGSNSEIKVDG